MGAPKILKWCRNCFQAMGMIGVPSCNTNAFQFRIIDSDVELVFDCEPSGFQGGCLYRI